jgi:hypothetical protein
VQDTWTKAERQAEEHASSDAGTKDMCNPDIGDTASSMECELSQGRP